MNEKYDTSTWLAAGKQITTLEPTVTRSGPRMTLSRDDRTITKIRNQLRRLEQA